MTVGGNFHLAGVLRVTGIGPTQQKGKLMALIDNPYWQALGAVVAELNEMGVDIDNLQNRVAEGLKSGKIYACHDKSRALAGIEALNDSIASFRLIDC